MVSGGGKEIIFEPMRYLQHCLHRTAVCQPLTVGVSLEAAETGVGQAQISRKYFCEDPLCLLGILRWQQYREHEKLRDDMEECDEMP